MKLKLIRVRRYTRTHWRLLLWVLAVTTGVCLLMLLRLGSLTGGLSANEVQQANFSSSWHHLAHNPLNLPLTFVQWLILTIIPHHGNTVTRAASPIFGVLALVSLAYILRRWYGVRTAVYGSVIFGLCSWFLHVSRYAGPDVLYLWATPTLIAVTIAWERHHTHRKAAYLALTTLSVLLYIPGLVWLVAGGLVLQRHLLRHAWKTAKNKLERFGLALLALLLLTPLVVAFVRTPSLARTWLGLPQTFGNLHSMARGLLHSISFFVYKGPATPELWLDRVPILSFFGTVMLLLGVMFYVQHIRAPRTRFLAAYFALGAVLFALGGPVPISIIVPLVYLVIAAGFGYLLHEWLQVFPRNPLARTVGFSLMGLTVALSCMYDLRAYYVAWPHNSHTESVFHKHP